MFSVLIGKSCDIKFYACFGRTGYFHLEGHAYLGSFFFLTLPPGENPIAVNKYYYYYYYYYYFKNLSLGAIWNFSKGTGHPQICIKLWGTKGLKTKNKPTLYLHF